MPSGGNRPSAYVPLGSAQGQVLFYGGADWEALAIGSDKQFLMSQGASKDIKWDTPSTYPEVGAQAYLSGDQALTDATVTLLEFDTTDFDLGSDFDTGNYKFVVPSDGIYLIALKIRTSNLMDGDEYSAWIYNNSTILTYRRDGCPKDNTALDLLLVCVESLAASDEITAKVRQDSGGVEYAMGGLSATTLYIMKQ